MKKVLKVFLIIIIIGAIGASGYFVYTKYISKSEERDAFSIVPEDAIFVIETTNLTKGWKAVSDSKIWKQLLLNKSFRDIDEYINMVDDYLKKNKAVDMILSNRKLLISSHMTSGVDWDFIIIADLQNVSTITGGLKGALGFVDGFKVEQREYQKTEIIELIDEKNPKTVIYMSIIDNLLLVTFTGELIERAISTKDDKHWKKNKIFQEAIADLSNRKLFKFYFNYSQLNPFSKIFLETEEEMIGDIGKSLGYTALNINLENERLSFDGFTNIDTIASYIRALASVKPGKMRAYEILSDQTAFYFSMGFDDYNVLYRNLIKEYESDNAEDMEDINKGINLVEKLLKINIQKDLFDWFGNEIAFIKLRPKNSTRIEDVVVAIHAKNIDDAKAGMGRITKQIRRRSPLKFEIINYNNFEINYLERKGLFKLFFGKLFASLEKPFFTFIEDYLVMSNSKETLMEVIDDYIKGNTLSHNKGFMDFKDEFEVKSNITLFVQMPKIYSNMYFYSNEQKRKSIKENKDIILSFTRIGLQLTSEGDIMKTLMIADHDENSFMNEELEKFEKKAYNDLFTEEYDSLRFKIILPDSIVKDGQYKTYYADSSTIKFEGTVSSNQLNGLWRTYYKSGNLRSSVNYKDGKADGKAYFYYDDGKQTKKSEVLFEQDVVVDLYQEFFENGTQKTTLNYKNGKLHGDAEFYYKNGKLKIKGKYKKGYKKGKWRYYDETGNVYNKEKFRKGMKK